MWRRGFKTIIQARIGDGARINLVQIGDNAAFGNGARAPTLLQSDRAAKPRTIAENFVAPIGALERAQPILLAAREVFGERLLESPAPGQQFFDAPRSIARLRCVEMFDGVARRPQRMGDETLARNEIV